MQMSWVDWSVVAGLIIFLAYTAINAQKHTKSVADFLAANRCAGRYLLATAEGTAALGAISVITFFEMFPSIGFTQQFWENVNVPIVLVTTLTGFVVYRYRATRAMTLAQFFEMRYSRKFRIYTGILAWVAGVVNFGIFPGVEARFFINFCGFQNHIVSIGSVDVNITLAAVMLILLFIALIFTFMGGQITVIISNFWQGFFCTIIFFAIVLFIWFKFPWSMISESLIIASKPGESLINPFDIAGKKDFNFLFFAISWFFMTYGTMAWQGKQGYNCSAITPHDARMSKVAGTLRNVLITTGLILMPLAAIVVLNHPSYADKAAQINEQLQTAFPDDSTLQTQMRIPLTLGGILPIGLFGGFAAAMLVLGISTYTSYLHSWGTILIQDVVGVLRKKPFSQKQHLWWLRLSIGFVAVFAFFFSLLFPLQEYIWMFFMITGAIFMGGAGAVIIGGLYWKRGTTAAAWAAMTVGSVLAVGSIVVRIAWPHIPYLVEKVGPELPYNSQVLSFWAAILAVATYVVVSLIGRKPAIDFDRLFHRGEYAIAEEGKELEIRGAERKPISRFWKLIGVNSHEFSRVDKGLFLYTVLINYFWFGSFVVLLIVGLCGWMTDQYWLKWWKIMVCVTMLIAFIGGIWVSIGGLFDLKKMYERLATIQRNILDDGRVADDHLLADESAITEPQKYPQVTDNRPD